MLDPGTIALIAGVSLKGAVVVGKYLHGKYKQYKANKASNENSDLDPISDLDQSPEESPSPQLEPLKITIGKTTITVHSNTNGDTNITVNDPAESNDKDQKQSPAKGFFNDVSSTLAEMGGLGELNNVTNIIDSVTSSAAPAPKSPATKAKLPRAPLKSQVAVVEEIDLDLEVPHAATPAGEVVATKVVTAPEADILPAEPVVTQSKSVVKDTGLRHKKVPKPEAKKHHEELSNHEEAPTSSFGNPFSYFGNKLKGVVKTLAKVADKFYSSNPYVSCLQDLEWDGTGLPKTHKALTSYLSKHLEPGQKGDFSFGDLEISGVRSEDGTVKVKPIGYNNEYDTPIM